MKNSRFLKSRSTLESGYHSFIHVWIIREPERYGTKQKEFRHLRTFGHVPFSLEAVGISLTTSQRTQRPFSLTLAGRRPHVEGRWVWVVANTHNTLLFRSYVSVNTRP